jgi:AhpD family alkylhydroperoxidase
MTRLSLITDDEADGDLAETFDFVRSRIGRVGNLYRTLGHAPWLLQRWIDFAWSLRNDATTDRGLRELAILRTAQINRTDYEFVAHAPMAVAAGISQEKIDALSGWAESPLFTPVERAVLGVAEQLAATTHITDDAWGALAEHFDDAELVELVMTAAFYACVSRVLGGLEVPPEG